MLCIGDIHGDKLKNLFPSNHLDLQFSEIYKAIDYARRQGETEVVFLGDLSENIRLSQEAECKFIKFFLDIDSKINAYVILGNHDFAETGNHSLLPFFELQRNKVFKTVRFFDKPEIVKIDGIKHNFSPYPYKEGFKDCINYGHFEVSGSIRDNGTVIKKAHNPGKKENWVLGHLHTPHDIGNNHYVGTQYQLNFGESLPKYFSIVTPRTSSGVLKIKKERIKVNPSFKLINLEIHDKKDLKKISDNPLYKYRLLIGPSFETTKDVLSLYPNVVKMEGFKNKKELQALVEESFIEINEQNLELPSIQEELKKFLKTKNADKKQIKRAFEIIEDIRNK